MMTKLRRSRRRRRRPMMEATQGMATTRRRRKRRTWMSLPLLEARLVKEDQEKIIRLFFLETVTLTDFSSKYYN